MPAMLVLSAAGLVSGIAVNEGYKDTTYSDGGGVQTIGFGTTTHPDGTPVKPGERTTPVRALIMLNTHVNKTEQAMRTCIGPVPLAQFEWDAYVSLAYNIGSGAFCGSTLVKKLHESPPDYAGACAQIKRWNKDNGKVIPGLVNRREREYRQCMGDTP
jgi:lysozyme